MTRLLLLAALLAGCSAKEADVGMADTANAGDGAVVGTLRLDVYPPAGVGDPQLLPQTHLVEPDAYEAATLRLFPTINVQGAVTGDVARTWAVDVPTTTEPIPATLGAWVDDTRLGASAQTDDAGLYRLDLPAYEDPYLLSVVPTDAALAPFHFESVTFTASERLNVALPLGIPVYGRVTDDEGQGIAGVPLRLRTLTESGVEVRSAPFLTDSTGWYVGRVETVGEYVLEVEGGALREADTTRVVPSYEQAVTVEDEVNGVTSYLSLGRLENASASGFVLDEAGEPIEDALVRFVSTSLDGGVGALQMEATTGRNGGFSVELMPGTYDVSLVPPYEVAASPNTLEDVTISGLASLGNQRLSSLSRLSGDVEDAYGSLLAGVVVAAKQTGFESYVYTATTDADGHYAIALPDGEYDVTFTPGSAAVAGALTRRTLRAGEPGDVTLDAGTLLSGSLSFDDAPVSWAWIDVIDVATGALVGQGTSDADGLFRLQVYLPETSADTADR